MAPPKVENRTKYDGRRVAALVKWVFRYLDLDGSNVVVYVVPHGRRWTYSGRIYYSRYVSTSYSAPSVSDFSIKRSELPDGARTVIVLAIGEEDVYPRRNSVYKRLDTPGNWMCEDWQEALISVAAHEGIHLRQYHTKPPGTPGRFNEVETEWGSFRAWRTWREEQKR